MGDLIVGLDNSRALCLATNAKNKVTHQIINAGLVKEEAHVFLLFGKYKKMRTLDRRFVNRYMQDPPEINPKQH